MNTKIILRLLKSISFIFGLIGYGILTKLNSNWGSSIIFAFVLAMYLLEAYRK